MVVLLLGKQAGVHPENTSRKPSMASMPTRELIVTIVIQDILQNVIAVRNILHLTEIVSHVTVPWNR